MVGLFRFGVWAGAALAATVRGEATVGEKVGETVGRTVDSLLDTDTAPRKAIVLTEKNFTHDTQIGTGMTTGDWFIKFYAPWCGHCRKLAPIWDELAQELYGEVNVAKMDTTVHRSAIGRFDIKAYPTLIFFKDDHYYRHSGPRTKEALMNFAREGYKAPGVVNGKVPRPLTVVTRITAHTKRAMRDIEMMVRHNPLAVICLVTLGSVVGTLIGGGVALYTTRSTASSSPTTDSKTKKKD